MKTAQNTLRIHQMTIGDFERLFPHEEACKQYLQNNRWPEGVICPRCGKLLLLKTARNGNRYLNCPDSKCKYATDADEKGDPVIPPDTGIACEKCGKPMVIKTSWRGPFLSCSGYPGCRNAKSINAEMREKLKANGVDVPSAPQKKDKAPVQTVDEACPQCGTMPMQVRKTFRGPFLGCTKYPDCKGTKKMTPEIEAKLKAAPVAAPAGEPAF